MKAAGAWLEGGPVQFMMYCRGVVVKHKIHGQDIHPSRVQTSIQNKHACLELRELNATFYVQ